MYSQELLLICRHGDTITRRTINHCRFVPLMGQYGWGGTAAD